MNPSLPLLFRFFLKARVRRIKAAVSSPRRILSTLLVALLALAWVGQTLASMLLREPFAEDSFRRWIALPFAAWFCWHIVRVAWKRPDEAIEWSPEEESLIVGGPFARHEILLYRFGVICTATLPKAALTTLVLWPDLTLAGACALTASLVLLELFRMVVDLAAGCLSKAVYLKFRVALLLLIAAGCAWQYQLCQSALMVAERQAVQELSVAQEWSIIGQAVFQNPFLQKFLVPFFWMADLVATSGSTTQLFLQALIFAWLMVVSAWAIVRLHAAHEEIRVAEDARDWKSRPRRRGVLAQRKQAGLPACQRLSPMGILAWRQFKRAHRFAGSLLISMGIPAMLSCLPLFSVPNATVAFVAVVCGLLFYTFVLLPEAIKFDFRLDTDHLNQLKMLPISSWKLVLGQLLAPTVLATLFQAVVIVFAGVYRSIHPTMIVSAVAITVPLTVLFVALDNLVFLMYPHRPAQEGFEAFLRTILKFTGKSLLMVLAGAVLVFWAPLASRMAATLHVSTATVFYFGIAAGLTLTAAVSLRSVVRAFERFDVSLDGIST